MVGIGVGGVNHSFTTCVTAPVIENVSSVNRPAE